MALEVSVGPPRLSISQGYGVLISDPDGQIPWPTDKGFYDSDTRLISSWQIFADGEPWSLLNGGNVSYFAERIFLTNTKIMTAAGVIEPGTVSLAVSRTIGGGIHEDLDITNHNPHPIRFNLEIAIRSDFADLFEVKSGNIVRRGQIFTTWTDEPAALETRYDNLDFDRSITVRIINSDCKAGYANGRITWLIELKPGQSWHACLLYEVGIGEDPKLVRKAPEHCIEHCHGATVAVDLREWRNSVVKITTSNEEFYRFYRQSVEDMAALRLPIEGTNTMQFVPAAGVPWFLGLFGRDSLIVSLQNAMVHPDFSRGALKVLGDLQAKERDDYRDAEPGKIMHELRRGELAHFKLIPHTPYYGTADATILYLSVLHKAWRCTGDKGLLEEFLPVAEGCLRWIDNWGDRDGDGFQEYQTRSPAGYENMAWKDSGVAYVYEDGSLVKGPKASCELQGYVYDAWLRMAYVFEALGKPDRAKELRDRAAALFKKFNEVFWDEEKQFYAFCLDGEKKKVMSIASNPGQLLWSGIVPPDRAAKVVERLMKPDMWSGWGIRTLSSDHPAYNPNSYQNGSVWPHDNALIALGFRRYGFVDEANRIARDVSGAAGYFALHRMPELYAGFENTPNSFPVQYLGANVPQAWAAGSAFACLQMTLGFQPDAPNDTLFIDPQLPEWIQNIDLTDLSLGDQTFDLHVWREDGATKWEVTRGDASKVQARSYATGANRAS